MAAAAAGAHAIRLAEEEASLSSFAITDFEPRFRAGGGCNGVVIIADSLREDNPFAKWKRYALKAMYNRPSSQKMPVCWPTSYGCWPLLAFARRLFVFYVMKISIFRSERKFRGNSGHARRP